MRADSPESSTHTIRDRSPIHLRAPRRLLVDIDGTLYYDFPVYRRFFRQLYGVSLRKADVQIWDFFLPYLSREQFDVVIREGLHAPATILSNKPFAGAVEVLSRWHAAGTEIHIISARAPARLAVTEAWLDAWGIPFSVLVCDNPIDKVAYARENNCELLIDDKPQTIEAAMAAGLVAASIRTNWTQSVKARYPQLLVARSWTALGSMVERALGAPAERRPG
jgi:uncharacterized HAD superfamily protein